MILDSHRFAHHRLRVQHGMAALGNGNVGKVDGRSAVSCHVLGRVLTKACRRMVPPEGNRELIITSTIIAAARCAHPAPHGVTVTGVVDQDILADAAVHQYRRGVHRSGTPTTSDVVGQVEIYLWDAEHVDESRRWHRVTTEVVHDAVDVLDSEPRVLDGPQARLRC